MKYRVRDDAVVITLATRVELAIPRKLLQGLENAAVGDVRKVTIEDFGSSLHWEALNVDHYVPGLIDGIFGTRKWMSRLGKIGGSSKTDAKQAAARENGRKGGRPKSVSREL